MRPSEPIASLSEAPTVPAAPDIDDANVGGIAATQAYLAGFAELFPDLVASRLAIRQYTVIRKIGAGAMGEVYLARDESLDRKVALKVVRAVGDDPRARDRMIREAQSLAQLSHTNVVQVYEVGEQLGEIFIAMEYIDGKSLNAWLAEAPRSLDARLEVLIAVGRGLAEAHAQGIIHRDIKPANILVSVQGRVCVADFGLASSPRAAPRTERTIAVAPGESARTLTHGGAGTPEYMSPEQHQHGELDARSDVFGFCVVAWEVVFGARPFVADTPEGPRGAICAGRIAPPPERSRGVRGRLEKLLRRGLATDRAARPQSMRDVVEALENLRRRRSWLPVVAGAIGASVALAVSQSYQAPELCVDVDQGLAAVWSAERGEALIDAAPPQRREAMRRSTEALDRFADDLRANRGALCRKFGDGTLSPPAYDRALACLDARQTDLAALAHGLRAAPEVVTSIEVAEARGRLDRCSDTNYLATGVDPASSEAADRIAVIRRLRLDGEGALLSGEFARAGHLFGEAVARARVVGHAPTTAAALYDEGRALFRLRRSEAATAALREARLLADGAGDRFLAADASLLLVNAAVSGNDLKAAEWFVKETGSLLRHAGRGPKVAEAELDLARVDLLLRQGQPDAAEALLGRAKVVLTEAGTKGLWRFTVPRLEARVALVRGQPKEAAAAIERAWAALEALVGDVDHPLYSEERGHFARLAGDAEGARVSLERARETYLSVYGRGSPQVAAVEAELARVFRAQEKEQEMVSAATRADEILRVLPEDPMTLEDRVVVADILGGVATKAGRTVEALERFDRAWRAIHAAKVPVLNDSLMRLATNAAELLVRVPDKARANEAIAAALACLAGQPGVDPATAVFVRRVASEVALASGDRGRAVDHAEAAYALLPSIDDPDTEARVLYALALALGAEDPRTGPLVTVALRIFTERHAPAKDLAELEGFLRSTKNNGVKSKRGTDRSEP